MLLRTDPFRHLDRLTSQAFGTLTRPAFMAMDAWHDQEKFVVEFDLPGIDESSLDLAVDRNVLTVRAERPAWQGETELLAAERPRGVFSRQLMLGDTLDTERVTASYRGGVLRLEIPVVAQAKPRKIAVSSTENATVVSGETDDEPTVTAAREPAAVQPRQDQQTVDA